MQEHVVKSVLILGSCVSRDLVATSQGRLRTLSYVARQSWISAFSPPSPTPPHQSLESKFQIRNLEGDWASSAPSEFRSRARLADKVLLDLVDERDGVYVTKPGRFVTNSAELRRSGWLPRAHGLRLVPFGSDEHFQLWEEAAAQMHCLLGELGLAERSTLLATPFTDYADDGEVPRHANTPAEEWNRLFTRYYDTARRLGFTVVQLPQHLARSTTRHTWGPAPYHYVPEAYRFWE